MTAAQITVLTLAGLFGLAAVLFGVAQEQKSTHDQQYHSRARRSRRFSGNPSHHRNRPRSKFGRRKRYFLKTRRRSGSQEGLVRAPNKQMAKQHFAENLGVEVKKVRARRDLTPGEVLFWLPIGSTAFFFFWMWLDRALGGGF